MFAEGSTTGTILVTGLVLIGAIVALGAGIWVVRRWLFSPVKSSDDDDWSLQHLREMRQEGQITDEEFETLKEKMIAAMGHSSCEEKDAG